MKYLLQLFFYSFLVSTIFAQNNTISIEWANSNNLAISKSQININGASSFFVDESNFTEQLITSWAKGVDSYIGANATNIRLETISSNSLGGIDKVSLPRLFEVSVVSKLARNKSLEVLSFNPLVNQNGIIKRIVSFDLKKNNNSRRSAKNFTVPNRTSSVLASGQWKRFEIDKTGVYKVTAQFLESIGLNLNGVNPETIKIYGTGGKPLPYINGENRFYDIPEVPVKVVGAGDGVFSGSDYLLFYGIGVQGYDKDNDTNLNPFSNEAYYYVTTGGSVQKKIGAIVEPSAAANTIFTDYDFETFSEKDLTNIGGIGRKWFGDEFDGNIRERDYRFSVSSPVVGSEITVEFPFGAVYAVPPSVTVTEGAISESFSFPSSIGSLAYRGLNGQSRITIDAKPVLNLKISVNNNGDPSSEVYLDYIRVFAKSNLRGVGRQFLFSNKDQASATGVSEFRISNAQNISYIWDVTDPYSISEKTNNLGLLSFKMTSGVENKFIAIDDNDFYNPKKTDNSDVPNQDLKGNIFRSSSENNNEGEVEYLIITRSDFLGSAIRLADFRKRQNGFNVKVVTVDQIYNEFSTGQQDISAIRNFIRYVYDNAKDPERRLKFLCFIGDGSYDYKDRLRNNTNIVPSYFASNSSSFANSFVSDDFYGMMGLNEGGNLSIDMLDIAVGRIVAPTPEIANDMVDKIQRYYNRDSYGSWRNNFLFVSDDVDNSNNGIDGKIQLKLDFVAEQVKGKLTNANTSKIFCDAFNQEVAAAGARYPVVKRSFLNAFESGATYINYFGHGGEDGLSSEFIFTANDARELTNRNRLTVFTTLTCELTRFDNPLRDTAGEFMYWNKNGGAVALLTTTRNLFVSTGLELNPGLADALFTNNQESIPIGEALRVAKNNLNGFGANKRTVFCIGDPAIKIVFPKPKVLLTQINDVSVLDADFDTKVGSLRALDRVKISGRVVSSSDNSLVPEPLKSFNGSVGVTLFDKTEKRSTLGNDGTEVCFKLSDVVLGRVDSCSDPGVFTIDFDSSGSQIFNGQATVKEGEFDIEFVLSKNIKLPVGAGKVSFYAQNSEVLVDQSGAAVVQIGGLNTEVDVDVKPPLISLFLNNENFQDGQLVNSTPNLIAKLEDDNGINTAGGVGHDILVVIDGDEKNPVNLNEFYTTELDDFTRGVINFRLKDLDPGEHTLKLRASDVFNNVSNQEITFIVGEKDQFTVSEVLNYPNPFTSYTEFWFSHTGPQQDVLDVMVQVLSISGKVITTKFATLSGNTNSYRGGISWDGRDDFGNKVGKGVYVYKIIIKSALTEKTFSKLEKLVVL